MRYKIVLKYVFKNMYLPEEIVIIYCWVKKAKYKITYIVIIPIL